MAKWGEGDPRWTEKNATHWSKEKLKELLNGLVVENAEFRVKLKEVTKCDGEASANNRKAKLIFFYEWVITGDWEATLVNSENKTVYKGTYDVPNLSEEHDPKDVDISVSVKDSKQDKLREFVRTAVVSKMREQFGRYIVLLREEFSQGLILPTKDSSSSNLKSLAATNATNAPPSTATEKASAAATAAASKSPNGLINESAKILTKKLSMNEEFKCRATELYRTFTDPNMVRAFTHNSNLVYEPEKGGKFALFDSNISGSFVELVEDKKIVMNWRNKRWPDEHYSVATLEFNEKEDCTVLHLSQTGIPHNFIENTEDGWRNFYFNAIRQTFGYGSRLF